MRSGQYDELVIAVYGRLVDEQTRCVHWRGPTDVIAIRFPCCDRYYACRECHDELETHDAALWGPERFGEHGVACGVCRSELAIAEYLESGFVCPRCGAAFNPRCATHYHLYFDLASRT